MIEVFILANGNSKIGLGHIKRSLMFVHQLQLRNIRCTYLSYDNDDIAKKELENTVNVIEINNNPDYFQNHLTYTDEISRIKTPNSTPILYVDSDFKPLYSEVFQKGIIEKGVKLMYATLYSNFHYYAHIVLNQNILALSQKYAGETYTKKLLGPKYFIWPEKARSIIRKKPITKPSPYKCFVNFGNADPNNVTFKVVQLLKENANVFSEVIVVVGPLYKDVTALLELVKTDARFQIVINSQNIYELMNKCDVAISSLGFTFWELTYMNIPSLVIAGSERERIVGEYIGEEKFAVKLGDFDDPDFKKKWTKTLITVFENELLLETRVTKLSEQINIDGVSTVIDEMIQLGSIAI